MVIMWSTKHQYPVSIVLETFVEDLPIVAQPTRLESLPTEIKTSALLRIPDVSLSLKTLLNSWPCYHGAYLAQRHPVLHIVIFVTIHQDVLYDA